MFTFSDILPRQLHACIATFASSWHRELFNQRALSLQISTIRCCQTCCSGTRLAGMHRPCISTKFSPVFSIGALVRDDYAMQQTPPFYRGQAWQSGQQLMDDGRMPPYPPTTMYPGQQRGCSPTRGS
ncbi:hypothetical protein KVT40_009248 [Elsinoe batatas]|uniref:Uncharacterized protein n=1 Tax=Elsinoe batatas TaxID=2601811 RepID=A0A8K0KS89_9PEZI|nr:hypothetical protein KVT40_009248 [Elsinoe batatas]